MSRTRERRTWADEQAIPTGIWNERWEGILICEANRATVFEYRPKGIQELLDYRHNNYRRKGIHSVVFGVDDGEKIAYAVFVRDGFIRDIPEDEDLTVKRKFRGKNRTRS